MKDPIIKVLRIPKSELTVRFLKIRDKKGVYRTWLTTNKSFQVRVLRDSGKAELIVVPPNFLSNGASVPRSCRFIVSPWSIPFAAVIHDWIYNGKQYSRRECDVIFRLAMRDIENYSETRRKLAFLAVRLFAHNHYKDDTKK